MSGIPLACFGGTFQGIDPLKAKRKCLSIVCQNHPVVMKDGNTYERGAIQTYLSTRHISPLTRQELSMNDATPNRTLKSLIDGFCSRLFPITVKYQNRSGPLETQIQVCLSQKIEALKNKIAEVTAIPVARQTLLFQNEVLDDQLTIYDCAIEQLDCIEVRVQPIQITIRDPSNRTVLFEIFPYETTTDLKNQIQIRLGLPQDAYVLSYHGKPLRDEDTIAEHRIVPHSTVMMTERVLGGSTIK
jgi:hypothetical protein